MFRFLCIHLCLLSLSSILHLTFPLMKLAWEGEGHSAGASDGFYFQVSLSVSIHCAGCDSVISSHIFLYLMAFKYASQPFIWCHPKEQSVAAWEEVGVLDLNLC